MLIQKDKDMVTLITCHPYPQNYQRYVVYCERTTDDAPDENKTATEPTQNYSEIADIDNSSEKFIRLEEILVVLVPVLLALLTLVLGLLAV